MSTFLERLRKRTEDRGLMASLRCVLVDAKRHRAWPALNRIGVNVSSDVDTRIAGLFATHPEETDTGNFGATCKAIEIKRGEVRGNDNKLTPTERRFQHLLAAEKGEELHQRVTRMVLMAKSEGVRVNYDRLASDLRWWSDRTKTEWAAVYWGEGTEFTAEEDA